MKIMRKPVVATFGDKLNETIEKRKNEPLLGFFKRRESLQENGKDFIFKSKTIAKANYYLNVSIWNNHLIMLKTGYTVEHLSDTLSDMARHLKSNLIGNRMHYFYLENIRDLENIPYN